MEIHPVYGPSLPEWGWVPAPRYLMRRDLIMDRLRRSKKSQLLEIGPGPAVLQYELARSGWSCTALEQSGAALEVARSLHGEDGLAEIFSEPQSNWLNRFDWLLAMEVLEHIEDDTAALMQWREWLKPGGSILLSVPAHKKKWNHTDVWAGHYRRYERGDLNELLKKCGFSVDELVSYGFPLSNIVEPIRAAHHGKLLKKRATEGTSPTGMRESTEQSGISRSLETILYPIYRNFVGVSLMKLAFWMQRRFLRTDLGTGYIVLARRQS